MVCPPRSKIGAITPEQRQQIIAGSLVAGVYEEVVDRESAYELLQARAAGPSSAPVAASAPATPQQGDLQSQPQSQPPSQPWYSVLTEGTGKTGRGDSILETATKSVVRTMGTTVGRELVRGLMGSLLGGTTGRRR
jgi:hypothetical protein